jgi:tripartite-type tricarboxylate transporter receptor subunit TctC
MRIRACLPIMGFALVCVLACALPAPPTAAQTWPQRSVRIIVPLPPGTGTDIAARLLAEELAKRWGQGVVVENRQGGDGIPAVTTFLAAQDVHTLLLSFAGIISINPLVHDRLPYDPAKDLVPIASVSDNFLGVAASATLKADTLADLVKLAKAQPAKLNWAATPGLPDYIVRALLTTTGIDMVQVAYREFGPALQDLNQGRLHIAATGVPLFVPHHRAGTAKLLFVTNQERSPQAPEVPTAREAGYPDLTFAGTVGIFGWRDMPADIRNRIATEVTTITSDPSFNARIAQAGTSARPGGPAEFAAAVEEQRAKIAAIHAAIKKQ